MQLPRRDSFATRGLECVDHLEKVLMEISLSADEGDLFGLQIGELGHDLERLCGTELRLPRVAGPRTAVQAPLVAAQGQNGESGDS